MAAATPPPLHPPVLDADRSASAALDCNLTALCDHILLEGFNAGAFSDVDVTAMGSTYHLHRLILSRSSYFRNMLHGPWKESDSHTFTLQIDDDNVNSEAIEMALAYLYGHHPKLNDQNAFRVLAAASFLDLQDLCAICTDFIISELWTNNFLSYQMFAERQDYGVHGERVRKACWGYLCQSGAVELREVLSRLSSPTLHSLLTSDRLWVPNEEKRFELALYTLLAKSTLLKEEQARQCPDLRNSSSNSSTSRGTDSFGDVNNNLSATSGFENLSIQDNAKNYADGQSSRNKFSDPVIGFQNGGSYFASMQGNDLSMSLIADPPSCNDIRNSTLSSNIARASCSYADLISQNDADRVRITGAAIEGPSGESTPNYFSGNIWLSNGQPRNYPIDNSSCNLTINPEWTNCGMPTSSWGARMVSSRQENNVVVDPVIRREEYDTFINIFEGGSLLYANMSFEALLNVRKQLEELGFPCKAVNDGLWLQMLLSQRVQEIGADTCRNCCLTSMSCACRQAYGYSQGGITAGYYRQENGHSNMIGGNIGNIYLADAQVDGSGMYGPVRVHVRGPIDGLAGIGRGTTFVSGSAWPPTRYVFSRVPFGLGSRNGQRSPGNEESDARVDFNGDRSGDGTPALAGSNSNNYVVPIVEQADRVYVAEPSSHPNNDTLPVPVLEAQQTFGLEWENSEASSISLDLKTPLRHFPPFRFGVEFEDVHRLGDGQVKHSPEVFYAGSLWKVSVQAFNDEDPQGRRTLGLFLHRRKAEPTDSLKKVDIYVDSREKVTARYQLICPSKREIMVFGSLRQPGTLLPKAPKGWGWRTALLFDELADLLQGVTLRVAAVVQLI